MWRGIKPISTVELREFENAFRFRITPVFREYLLEHNGGIPTPGIFPTEANRNRKMQRLLDFTDRYTVQEAWSVNTRLQEAIGEKRIVIGTDTVGNFICLEREYKRQYIVLWNHLTDQFERSLLDIPAFLDTIG